MAQELPTVDAVVDALGGTAATARLLGVSMQSVTNWRAAGRLPPRKFLVIREALVARGHEAPVSLWGMEEPA